MLKLSSVGFRVVLKISSWVAEILQHSSYPRTANDKLILKQLGKTLNPIPAFLRNSSVDMIRVCFAFNHEERPSVLPI